MSWEDLLESSRQGASPEPGVRERVRARLQAQLAPPAPSLPAPLKPVPPPPPEATSWGASAPWRAKLLWGVLGLCAGFTLGRGSAEPALRAPSLAAAVGASAAVESTAKSTVGSTAVGSTAVGSTAENTAGSRTELSTVQPAGTAPDAKELPAASAARAAPARPGSARAVPPRAVPPRASPSARQRGSATATAAALPATAAAEPRVLSDADRLREALAYLQRAHAALRDAEPSTALRLLSELDQRVPGAVLEEERAATLALAWCDSGEPARASQVARRLLQLNPASVYARSLAESCIGRERVLEEMRARTSKP